MFIITPLSDLPKFSKIRTYFTYIVNTQLKVNQIMKRSLLFFLIGN